MELAGDQPMPRGRLAMAAAAAACLGLAFFQWMYGIRLVLLSHPFWLEPRGDMRTMMAGFYAISREPWSFPPTLTDDVRWPEPVSIVFTDSIPWHTLALKALGLTGAIGPLGSFLLLSFALQGVAMVAVLRASGVRQAGPLILGAGLALLFPAWLARQFGHIALCGHWVILFSLALAIGSARHGLTWPRILGFAAVAVIAAGVHPYLLVSVGACFGASLLSELLQRRPGAFARTALGALVVAVATGLAAFILGFHVGSGQSGGGQSLGLYSMNIGAPIWPQASALAGQRWENGWFTGAVDATNGGQAFEGFNYLGGGVLLLLVLVLLLKFRDALRGDAPPSPPPLARFGPLALALVILTLMAIGPIGYLGMSKLWELPRPGGHFGELVGHFRAHGRFFWLAGYAVLALAIVQICARTSPRAATVLIGAALALQAYDAHRLLLAVRSVYAETSRPLYDPRLRTSPAFAGRNWRFAPVFECAEGMDMELISQLSALALRRGGSSNSVPTARNLVTTCELPADVFEPARPGDRRLVVVATQPGKREAILTRFHRRADCYVMTGGFICGEGLGRVPGLTRARIEPPGRWAEAAVYRADQGQRPPILGQGWSVTEPRGIWSDGRHAMLRIPSRLAQGAQTLRVDIEGSTFRLQPSDSQRVQVYLGDRLLTELRMSDGRYRVDVPVPRQVGEHIELSLRFPDARSPAEAMPPNADTRVLGVGLRAIIVMR